MKYRQLYCFHTILLVVFFSHPFNRKFDILVRDLVTIEEVFQELQGLRSKGVAIFPKHLS